METTPLIKACKENAKSLLEEFSEFFPFAFGLTSTETIVSVNTQMPDGDEFPNANKVLDELQKALLRSHRDNNFNEVCICVDVRVNIPRSNIPSDAVEIRLNFRDSAPINYYAPYKIEDSEIVFGEDFYEDGEEYMRF